MTTAISFNARRSHSTKLSSYSKIQKCMSFEFTIAFNIIHSYLFCECDIIVQYCDHSNYIYEILFLLGKHYDILRTTGFQIPDSVCKLLYLQSFSEQNTMQTTTTTFYCVSMCKCCFKKCLHY